MSTQPDNFSDIKRGNNQARKQEESKAKAQERKNQRKANKAAKARARYTKMPAEVKQARAAERKQAAAEAAKGRRERAAKARASVNTGAKVGGRSFADYFAKRPGKAVSNVRVRNLLRDKPGHTSTHAEIHNDPARVGVTNADHIDPGRIKDNMQIWPPAGQPWVKIRDLIDELKAGGQLIQRGKAGKFEGLEALFSLSPEVWESVKPEARDDFARAWGEELRAFIAQRFDGARLMHLVLHRDEINASPNAKALILPLVHARTRGAPGEPPKLLCTSDGRPVFELSKKSLKLDTPEQCSDLQTEFANHLRARGWQVERGQVHEMPKRHIPSPQFYRQLHSEAENEALGNLKNLQTQIGAKSEELNSLQDLIDRLKAKRSAAARELSDTKKELEDLKNETTKTRGDISEAKRALEEIARKRAAAEISEKKARRDARNISATLKLLHASAQRHAEATKAANARRADAERDEEEAGARLGVIRDELEEVQAELAATSSSLETVEQTKERARALVRQVIDKETETERERIKAELKNDNELRGEAFIELLKDPEMRRLVSEKMAADEAVKNHKKRQQALKNLAKPTDAELQEAEQLRIKQARTTQALGDYISREASDKADRKARLDADTAALQHGIANPRKPRARDMFDGQGDTKRPKI